MNAPLPCFRIFRATFLSHVVLELSRVGGLMFSVMETRLITFSCSRSQELSGSPTEIENNRGGSGNSHVIT